MEERDFPRRSALLFSNSVALGTERERELEERLADLRGFEIPESKARSKGDTRGDDVRWRERERGSGRYEYTDIGDRKGEGGGTATAESSIVRLQSNRIGSNRIESDRIGQA
ncbi:hypothetical protein ANTRET_LOCUS7589 [Anthophora retusa]